MCVGSAFTTQPCGGDYREGAERFECEGDGFDGYGAGGDYWYVSRFFRLLFGSSVVLFRLLLLRSLR